MFLVSFWLTVGYYKVSSGGVISYTQTSDCAGISTPNPYVVQRSAVVFFNKWCWDNYISTYKRIKFDPYLTPHTQIN